MKNNNVFAVIVTYLLYGVIVAIIGYAIISIVLKPQNPLVNAQIPQSTIDWFQGLIDGGSDIGGVLGPDKEPSEWTQYENIDSMLRVEDDFFVIYYSSKDSVVEHDKALICQQYAHAAIPRGELIMKNYPYPDKIYGRKLPIYLANTEGDYISICKQLNHTPSAGSIGMYVFQIVGEQVYTDGVLLSPQAWSIPENTINAQTKDEYFRRVLWHEMNHFMYLSNWDLTKITEPCLWFTEGLAEYFAENFDRLNQVGNYRKLNLTDDFMGNLSEYWGGLSAFLCLENLHGKTAVYRVVQTTYTNSIDESVARVVPGENLKSWNAQWHFFMDNKEYQKYM